MAKCNKDIAEIAKKCTVLLLDIEGTTTSISFVKDKLFPYAVENVEKFLESHWDEEDVKKAVADLRKQAADDVENKVEDVVPVPTEDASKEDQVSGLVKNVKWQISVDRKAGPLKFLQGLFWKQGYENGDIKGHVYEDVAPALVQWRSVDDKKVYIYSSGSVQAQKLIFGQSEAGDLTKHIDGYFDTEVGAKQEANSYKNIVEKIDVKAEKILFLTDIPKEATAATAAGLHSALLDRPGNASLADEDKLAFPVLTSLAELAPSQKRKPDAQEEVQPAKVAKTEAESDVKKPAEVAEVTLSKVVKEKTPAPKEAKITLTDEVESMEVTETPVEEEVIKTADAKTDNDKEKDQECMETDSAVTEVEIKELSDTEKVAEEVINLTPVVEEPATSEEVKTDKVENKGEEKADVVTKKVDTEITSETDKDVEMQVEKTVPAIVIEEVKTEDKPSCSVIDKLDITDAEPVVEEPVEECVPETTKYKLMRTEGWPVSVEEDQEAECDEIMVKVDDVRTDVEDSKVKNIENKEPPVGTKTPADVGKVKTQTDKVEKVKTETEKVEKVKKETEKVEKGKTETEKVEKAKAVTEKVEKGKTEKEKVEKVKAETEKVEKVKSETEKVEKVKAETEKVEKLKSEKVEKVKTETEKVGKVKTETEKVEKVKTEAEKIEKVEKVKTEAEKIEKVDTEAQTLEITKEKTVVEKKVITKESEKPNEDVEIAEVIDEKKVESKVEINDITEENKKENVAEKAKEQTEEKENKTKTSTTNEKVEESKEDAVAEETKDEEIAMEKDPTPPIPEPNGEKMEEDEKATEEIESPVVKENGSNESETIKKSAEDRLETNGVDKTLNGDSVTKSLNGDTQVNGEEAVSRVSEESHEKEERLNGSNGAKTAEEESMETEVAEIKVKSIPVDETAVPIEQATEA